MLCVNSLSDSECWMYNDGMCVGLREVLLPIIPVAWLSTLYKACAANGFAAFSGGLRAMILSS